MAAEKKQQSDQSKDLGRVNNNSEEKETSSATALQVFLYLNNI